MAAETVATRRASTQPRTRSPRRLPSLKTVIIAAAAYAIAIIFLLPYVEMIITALRPPNELLERNYLPHHFAWSNLTNMWGPGYGITTSLRISLEVAGGATVVVLLVAIPAAYYTARHHYRGRWLFLLIVLITQMLQPTALIIGIYKEFLGFHLVNTVWSLFLVTLPLAAPGLVTALIFTFIAAWNEFIVALTLTTGSAAMPLTVRLDSFIGQYTVDWQHLFGASVVATIPVVILFALIERRVVGGLTAGSIK